VTPKQERFVSEYLLDLNGTQAAIRAGYSERGADVQAVRLLGNARVKVAVQEAAAKQHQRLELNADTVLGELMGVAYAKVPVEDIRVADKLRALETLAKHLNLLTKQVHVASDIDFIQMVQLVRERLAKQPDDAGRPPRVGSRVHSPGDPAQDQNTDSLARVSADVGARPGTER
jgi:phage terminase small subunit